ncbi:Ankyrin repeat [bacterium A37T11]|nr:Ankyrin repeat [bacterium A37T11]
MATFDQAVFFKAIYDYTEEDLIQYLKENFEAVPASSRDQLVNTVMQRKKWQVLDYMLDEGLIQTELFEYDSFDDKQIQPLIGQTKYLNQQELAEYLPHFEKFLQALEDMDEELAGQNLLSYALENGLPEEVIAAIIHKDIKLDYHNRAGQNYLHIAVSQRQNRNSGYSFAIAKLLIENGIDVNEHDIEGKTPLYSAIENEGLVKADTIQLLVENGADVVAEDKKGITPLFFVSVYTHNLELTRLLLQYGTPDFTKRNREGEIFLNGYLRHMQVSASGIEMLIYLIENGASLAYTSTYYGKEKSGIDWVIEKPSEILKSLLDKNLIDVNWIDNDGQTVLIKVCQVNTNHEEALAKDLYRKVKYLLKAGADPSMEDRFDKKAVDYAMDDNMKAKIVETLLEK